MTELVAITCPRCNASVQVPADRKICYCSYCGTQLMFDDGSQTITYRTIDEARIRETDNETVVELKMLEMEERDRARRTKAFKVLGVAGGVVFLAALIIGQFDETRGVLLGELGTILFLIGMMIFVGDNDDNRGDGGLDDQRFRAEDYMQAASGRKMPVSALVAAVAALAIGVGKLRK